MPGMLKNDSLSVKPVAVQGQRNWPVKPVSPNQPRKKAAMNLSGLKTVLKEAADKHFRLKLPDGSPVPVSFHVTEVGRVQKTFIDCGGVFRETVAWQLQIWVGPD